MSDNRKAFAVSRYNTSLTWPTEKTLPVGLYADLVGSAQDTHYRLHKAVLGCTINCNSPWFQFDAHTHSSHDEVVSVQNAEPLFTAQVHCLSMTWAVVSALTLADAQSRRCTCRAAYSLHGRTTFSKGRHEVDVHSAYDALTEQSKVLDHVLRHHLYAARLAMQPS